jgi:hypothetical protein
MADHAHFKQRIDALILEYEQTVPPKPRAKAPPDGFY